MNVKTVSFKSARGPEEFVSSILESGFAVITDHPIPPRLIFDAFAEWGRFFASEEKHKYTFEAKAQTGYFPFRSENAKDSQKKDLKEFFHYYPKRMELPENVQEFTPKIYTALNAMGIELLSWIQKETPEEVRKLFPIPLTEMIKDSEDTLLRALHYPPLTGVEEEGAVRAAAHEDINLITLLPAATAPGLQVKDTHGNWHDVPCDPGTIVINSGDMLRETSGGFFPSTTHQVVNPRGPASRQSRYSMPLFLHPRQSAPLSPRYPRAGDYLAQRLREIGLK